MQFKCISCEEWDVPDELIGDNDPEQIASNFECDACEEQRQADHEVNSWEMNSDNQLCVVCGLYREWEDCWNGCDDGYHYPYDEDPLWHDEDDTELCNVCRGKGGWWVCPNASNHHKEAVVSEAVSG